MPADSASKIVKFTISIPRESCTDAKAKYSSSVVPPDDSVHFYHWSVGGLEYKVPQSLLYCLCINVALSSTALQCICRVIRRSSMTMKAHTYYIIFGRPPIGGKLPLSPLAALLATADTWTPAFWHLDSHRGVGTAGRLPPQC